MVALHPNYVYSYAPATVDSVYSHGARVVFYDGTERMLPWSEMYKISDRKYTESVEYISVCEKRLCSTKAVVWDQASGYFRLSKALKQSTM